MHLRFSFQPQLNNSGHGETTTREREITRTHLPQRHIRPDARASSCSWTTDLSHGIFWIRRKEEEEEEEEEQQQQEEVGSQVGEAGRLGTSLILFF